MYVTEYKTVFGEDSQVFDKNVNEAIKAGFQPFGHLQAVFDSRTYSFFQAMVKTKDESKPAPANQD